ncbi:histidine kinase [Aquabacterium sp. NJ1]|uniref:ATP-binding protein n=1 Tax=Aquabacterium sp. NJ1 TaxID=1538295 RepID=UPI00052BBF81|nr:ATP-binding protein [Aquabacterium sp. NJ1]KGM40894.1 histidine kinase [Aquabacterium sp. NJ1]
MISPLAALPAEPVSPTGDVALAPERLAHSNNLLQLIQMRWLAVAGQLFTILIVEFVLGMSLPVIEMVTLLAVLAVFNIASWLRQRLALPVSNGELFAGLLVDVGVLTCQLYYSGGSANPFIYLYLLQVAVGSVLLRPIYTWAMVLVTSLCFVALTQWHRPLAFPDVGGPAPSAHYVGGLLACFLINASLLVIFIGRIGRNLRQRDARLADLRQRAAEEEHIVRMGLLASGAAHELGTPLATLSVILGDWARMTPFAAEPELREEIEQMQVQVSRCKSIVTGILQSAGETRGEAPEETTLHDFLDELVEEWRQTRPVKELIFDRHNLPDVPFIADTALRQMIDNVLDNALEAAPQGLLRVQASCEDDTLTLRVQDQGPGFTPQMLQRFGKPYESSKGRPGGGLGLFLSVNVARTLGGRIEAHNRPGGGAEVVITLPLASLMTSK